MRTRSGNSPPREIASLREEGSESFSGRGLPILKMRKLPVQYAWASESSFAPLERRLREVFASVSPPCSTCYQMQVPSLSIPPARGNSSKEHCPRSDLITRPQLTNKR